MTVLHAYIIKLQPVTTSVCMISYLFGLYERNGSVAENQWNFLFLENHPSDFQLHTEDLKVRFLRKGANSFLRLQWKPQLLPRIDYREKNVFVSLCFLFPRKSEVKISSALVSGLGFCDLVSALTELFL